MKIKAGFAPPTSIKLYINGKRSRKKIIITDKGIRFIKPLNITKKDDIRIYYKWGDEK